MSGVSATHLIMFVASLLVAAGIAGTVVVEVNQMSSALETRGTHVAEEIETEIAIISDESQTDAIVDAENDTVTVLVKNVGSRSAPVDPTIVDVLIDGGYVPNEDVVSLERVDVDGSDTWRPGGVVEITVEREVSGDTEITVVVNGNEDSIRFHVQDAEDT